ncbi:MAG: beta-ketoacyl-ACP synthase II [Planctomycetota bacterium]
MSTGNKQDGTPRLVITGIGAVTNLGVDAASTWESMREGRSGCSRVEGDEFARFDGKWATKVGGQVRGYDVDAVVGKREAKRLDRATHLALGAGTEAVEHSGIGLEAMDRDRVGVIVGSGIGGIYTIEQSTEVMLDKGPDRINPFTVPRLMANAAAANLSLKYGITGPSTTHVTACASSGHAFGDAIQRMRSGYLDAIVVGGTEAACTPLCMGSFMTMKAMTTRNDEPTKASRPFDVDRDGFILAEGAAMFVVETEAHAKARGATIHAELLGAADASDAHHITAPDPSGGGATRAMRWALRDAGLSTDDIDYVNAHGTSTPLGDRAEVEAVLGLFGDHARASAGGKLLMSSTKSMHGHALGASGAIELIACIHAVRDGVIAPTINLDEADEGMDVDLVPHEARERPIRRAMNNTFGFGGHNVSMIVGRYEG